MESLRQVPAKSPMVSKMHADNKLSPVFLSIIPPIRDLLGFPSLACLLSALFCPNPKCLLPPATQPSSFHIVLPSLSSLHAPLTRSVSSVLLDSGPLAVESIVGGALELCARGSPATSGSVAESGKRLRGARSGAKAEHGVECGLGD